MNGILSRHIPGGVGAAAGALLGGVVGHHISPDFLPGPDQLWHAGLGGGVGYATGAALADPYRRAVMSVAPATGMAALDRSRSQQPDQEALGVTDPEKFLRRTSNAPMPEAYALIRAHEQLGVHTPETLRRAKQIYNARHSYRQGGLA